MATKDSGCSSTLNVCRTMMWLLIFLISAISFVKSFTVVPTPLDVAARSNKQKVSLLYATRSSSRSISSSMLGFDRKEFLHVVTGSLIVLCPFKGAAADWSLSSQTRPVAVLGAGGRTGMEVVQTLAREGIYTVTMTRTGVDPFRVVKLPAETKAYVSHYGETANVASSDSLQAAMKTTNPSAIIFCASASKQGGTAFEVDDEGVGNAAQVARDLSARLIVVSALAVDRPDSKSYQITNTLGGNLKGIMDAKLQGEIKVRHVLKDSKDYVIIRPGVLLSGKSLEGASGIELNQEDTIGGGLSRDELAGVVVGGLQSGKKGVTVEAYRRKTATALQPEFALPSGREAKSSTYKGLFANVLVDT